MVYENLCIIFDTILNNQSTVIFQIFQCIFNRQISCLIDSDDRFADIGDLKYTESVVVYKLCSAILNASVILIGLTSIFLMFDINLGRVFKQISGRNRHRNRCINIYGSFIKDLLLSAFCFRNNAVFRCDIQRQCRFVFCLDQIIRLNVQIRLDFYRPLLIIVLINNCFFQFG